MKGSEIKLIAYMDGAKNGLSFLYINVTMIGKSRIVNSCLTIS